MAPTVEDQLCLVDAFLLKSLFYYNFTEEEGERVMLVNFLAYMKNFGLKNACKSNSLVPHVLPFCNPSRDVQDLVLKNIV